MYLRIRTSINLKPANQKLRCTLLTTSDTMTDESRGIHDHFRLVQFGVYRQKFFGSEGSV